MNSYKALATLALSFFLTISAVAADSVAVAGHGGSTPDPLYKVWLPDYNAKHPEAHVYYLALRRGDI